MLPGSYDLLNMRPPLRFPPVAEDPTPARAGRVGTVKPAHTAKPAKPARTPKAAKALAPNKNARRPAPPSVDDRRAHVLEAALRVFEEKGLEGANMRSIAREAGYTPGALYFYYASQEEIYADLLSHSLRRLHAATCEAGAEFTNGTDPRALVVARALAFYDYYATRPDELSLGFYLFRGIGPHGLTRELNERLNTELWRALAGLYDPLVALGRSREEALAELTSAFGHCVGMLLLVHTGRIRMFRQDGRELFRAFVENSVGVRGPGR